MTKDEILEAIRATTQRNGGKPLGRIRLLNETGIAEHHYSKFGTLGQLQREAVSDANRLNTAKSRADLIAQMIDLCCRYRRFPTSQQLRQAHEEMPSRYSSHNTFNRLGKTNAAKAATVVAALSGNDCLTADEQTALDICLPIAEQAEAAPEDPSAQLNGCGYVYLFRDGKAYKIGNSTDPDSRRDALQTGNPRRIELVHRILTDDPKGIEEYWHRRFSHCRIKTTDRSEWFHLSRDEVATFRARIRM